MINSNFASSPNFQAFKRQRYNEIYSHEMAHKAAIGSLGGPIQIDKDSNGVAFSGHVEVKMPTLNQQNPDETIDHAKMVINSALAPSDPSNQDYKVASQAQKTLQEAKDVKTKKDKLDIIA